MEFEKQQGAKMARRIELKGVANALNACFVSRNNDFAGYWAIGQLKSFAIANSLSSIKFSLIEPNGEFNCNLQNYIVAHYSGILGYLLTKQQIPECWVIKAGILIDFNVHYKQAQLFHCSASGEPYRCCCEITDDTGRRYASIIYGRCQPHSAVKELKSSRKSTI